jgi:hypothetical protein
MSPSHGGKLPDKTLVRCFIVSFCNAFSVVNFVAGAQYGHAAKGRRVAEAASHLRSMGVMAVEKVVVVVMVVVVVVVVVVVLVVLVVVLVVVVLVLVLVLVLVVVVVVVVTLMKKQLRRTVVRLRDVRSGTSNAVDAAS